MYFTKAYVWRYAHAVRWVIDLPYPSEECLLNVQERFVTNYRIETIVFHDICIAIRVKGIDILIKHQTAPVCCITERSLSQFVGGILKVKPFHSTWGRKPRAPNSTSPKQTQHRAR
jgi:hypothetical protein